MSLTVADAVRSLMERRQSAAQEIASIDAELADIRRALEAATTPAARVPIEPRPPVTEVGPSRPTPPPADRRRAVPATQRRYLRIEQWEQAVVGALVDGLTQPKQIARHISASKEKVQDVLFQLVHRGVVTKTGFKRNVCYRLAPGTKSTTWSGAA